MTQSRIVGFIRRSREASARRRGIAVGLGLALLLAVDLYFRTQLLWMIPFGLLLGAAGGFVIFWLTLRQDRGGDGPDASMRQV